MNIDRYTIRRIVNDLIDELINEGVKKETIIEIISDVDTATKDFIDINWLYENNNG